MEESDKERDRILKRLWQMPPKEHSKLKAKKRKKKKRRKAKRKKRIS
jgi:hypothetical protein